MAIERPKYTLETSEGPYEIRDYAPNIVAVVHVDGSRSEAANAGFRLLASYIFGDNQAQVKIARTTPVTQRASHSLTMAAPVEQNSTGGGAGKFASPCPRLIA